MEPQKLQKMKADLEAYRASKMPVQSTQAPQTQTQQPRDIKADLEAYRSSKIGSTAQPTREQRIEQGLPVGSGSRAEPTVVGGIIRDIVKPVVKVGASIKNIGQVLAGQPETDIKTDYLGTVPRVGKGFDPAQGLTKENIKAVKESVGTGAELASFLPVGTGLKAGVTILKQPFKQAIVGAGKTLAKEGAVQGGFGNFGRSLQEDKGLADTVLSTLGGVATGGALGFGLGSLGAGASRLVTKKPVEAIKNEIIKNTSKALGLFGKKPVKGALNQGENMARGLATVRKYADNFDPNTSDSIMKDTLDGLIKSKGTVFKLFDDSARNAGEQGISIETKPLEKSLESYMKGITTAPKKARAQRLLAEMRSNFPEGKATPSQMQAYIQLLNEELGGVSGGAERGAVGVVADFTKKARESMDDAIAKTGNKYQAFRDEYAALKAVEDGLVRAYQKVMRRKGSGLTDYADMIANAEMLSGIISANPALMAKSAVMRLGSKFIKNINDPERLLREAFKGIDKIPGGF